MNNDDFYIGYLPKMPSRPARFVKVFAIATLGVAVILIGVFWIGQKRFARSVFEFGNVREFRGTIRSGAVPFLIFEKDTQTPGLPEFERIPLVAEGKHGADVEAFDAKRVSLRGTLIFREEMKMIEIAVGSISILDVESAKPLESGQLLGGFTLRGEIVDSKCYLGVMNPGSSKPHRDCAVACIRGGVPPLFLVTDSSGNVSELWIVGESGHPIGRDLLDFVAEPVELSGQVERRGDQLFFWINPANIKRLP